MPLTNVLLVKIFYQLCPHNNISDCISGLIFYWKGTYCLKNFTNANELSKVSLRGAKWQSNLCIYKGIGTLLLVARNDNVTMFIVFVLTLHAQKKRLSPCRNSGMEIAKQSEIYEFISFSLQLFSFSLQRLFFSWRPLLFTPFLLPLIREQIL